MWTDPDHNLAPPIRQANGAPEQVRQAQNERSLS